MKHRHKLSQRQRQRATSQSRRSEAQETDEQWRSSAGNAKSRAAHHMHAEGKRPKPRLDKFRRGGRRPKRYDDGGSAGGTGSTRPNDPGGEVSAANKGRKSTVDWIRDEVMGGTKPAYKRGGRQRLRKYDAGGATSLAAPPPSFNTPSLSDFAYSAKPNPIVAMVQKAMPPIDTAGKVMAARGGAAALASLQKNAPSFPGSPKVPVPANKRGGRAKQREAGGRK